jgi:uncharacterized membrane protein
MDSQLVVFRFDSAGEADQVEAALRSLAAEGFLTLEDAARLTRDDDGTVTVQPRDLGELARGSTLGGVLGLLAGGIIGLPVVGLLAGAGLGARHSLHAERLEHLLGTVGRDMASGTVVLAVLVSAVDDPDSVADRLSLHRESILALEIPEELRAHIDNQRAAGERGSGGA